MNNFSWPNFFVGILGIALGLWITKDAYHINHHILFMGWAERKYGPGTGTVLYRFFGIGLVCFSILVMIGTVDVTGSSGFTAKNGTQIQQTQNYNSGGNSKIAP